MARSEEVTAGMSNHGATVGDTRSHRNRESSAATVATPLALDQVSARHRWNELKRAISTLDAEGVAVRGIKDLPGTSNSGADQAIR